ncbi:MAG TPA: penicillin-binding transpeptidase domain-containing protein [Pyrinomonadaceae bacterium]|jgi:beta-lactamase class D
MTALKVCFIMVLALAGSLGAGTGAEDLSPYFKDKRGAFVLYDLKNDRYLRYDEARCRTRFSPFSTFKIPNSLIGLESGVIRDAEFVIAWNRAKYPPQENWNIEPFVHWGQDQTLSTAFKYSVVWYYRELALRVGAERMKSFVARLDYGNRDTSGGLDRFWLGSSLRISADEQVEFLKRLYAAKLPVSPRSLAIVRKLMIREETPAYRLSGKTGGGSLPDGKALGWFVGYVETKGNVYFFATNLEGPDYLAIRDERIDLTKRILAGLGYLPKP